MKEASVAALAITSYCKAPDLTFHALLMESDAAVMRHRKWIRKLENRAGLLW